MSIFFSQGNWLVVLACLYLMFSSIAGIRGSFRAEKRMVDIYYLALLIFMGIYAVAFLIYMLVDGVAPTAKTRSETARRGYFFFLVLAVHCSAVAPFVTPVSHPMSTVDCERFYFFLLLSVQLRRVVLRDRVRFGLHLDDGRGAALLRSLRVGDENQSLN